MEVIAASSGEGNLSSEMMSWHLLVSSCINSDGVSVADVLLSVLSQVLPLLNLNSFGVWAKDVKSRLLLKVTAARIDKDFELRVIFLEARTSQKLTVIISHVLVVAGAVRCHYKLVPNPPGEDNPKLLKNLSFNKTFVTIEH